MLFANNQKQM